MKHSSRIAMALALTAVAMPATAQRLGQERPKDAKPQEETADTLEPAKSEATTTTGRKVTVSREAQKAIVELQNAVNAKDPAVAAKVQAALKVAKTSDDKYIIGSNQARAAVAANDLPGLQAGLDLMAGSGSGEAAILSMNYADLGKRYITTGNSTAANVALEKAVSLDANNAAALALLADQKSKGGDKAGAVALMQKSFAASKASGKKVAEGNYKFATKMAADINSPLTMDITREWVMAYPTPDSWRAAIQLYRSSKQPRGQQLVDLWRLARANNAVRGEADYDSYLSALISTGNLAEAKAVLGDAAHQSNVDMTKNQFKDHSAKAAKAPARAAVDAQLKAAATADAMIKAGDGLYGLGAYAEAAAAYRAALAKGGDTNLANLRLGMALARSGDKAGAAAALKLVTGPNADIARYWLVAVGA
jgi:tetratricopeptide (TPR) repeat protein